MPRWIAWETSIGAMSDWKQRKGSERQECKPGTWKCMVNHRKMQMIPVHLVEDPSFLVAVFQEPTTMVRLMEGLTSTNAGCVVWYFSVLHYVSACPGFGSIERLRQVLMRITYLLGETHRNT